jgi:hypothetical protein
VYIGTDVKGFTFTEKAAGSRDMPEFKKRKTGKSLTDQVNKATEDLNKAVDDISEDDDKD